MILRVYETNEVSPSDWTETVIVITGNVLVGHEVRRVMLYPNDYAGLTPEQISAELERRAVERGRPDPLPSLRNDIAEDKADVARKRGRKPDAVTGLPDAVQYLKDLEERVLYLERIHKLGEG